MTTTGRTVAKRARSWALRVAAGGLLFLSLAGPAPGNTGGCRSTVPTADAHKFCTDRRYWECRRDQYAGRIDTAQYDACLSAIDSACAGSRAWPPGCFPTPAQADSCLLLLMRADLASTPTNELLATYEECTLCP